MSVDLAVKRRALGCRSRARGPAVFHPPGRDRRADPGLDGRGGIAVGEVAGVGKDLGWYWLESQLELVGQVGVENYLSQQIRD